MRSTTKFIGATCLTLMAVAGTGCGGDSATCGKDSAKGTATKFVTSDVMLPSGTMTFGTDIDGNGKPDNQLAKITGVIGSQFDLAGPVTKSVKDGDLLIGMAVTSENLSDSCASVTASLLKKPPMAPKLDGTDTLTVDAGQMAATLYGGIGPAAGMGVAMGKLSTITPPKQTGGDVQKIQLNIPLADGALPLAIQGAHIEGTVNDKGIMSGQIHGVISKTDVDTKIIPAIAELLTKLINKDPNSSSAKTVIQLFEDMKNPISAKKCMVEADCCAKKPMTCKIIPEEVKGQSLIGSFLAPDVQVFDASGAWKPVAGGSDKNGMSVGLGFTAVRASF